MSKEYLINKIVYHGYAEGFQELIDVERLLEKFPSDVVTALAIETVGAVEMIAKHGKPADGAALVRKLLLLVALDAQIPPMMDNKAIANRIVYTMRKSVRDRSSSLDLRDDICNVLTEYFPRNTTSLFPDTLNELYEKYLVRNSKNTLFTAGDYVIDKKTKVTYFITTCEYIEVTKCVQYTLSIVHNGITTIINVYGTDIYDKFELIETKPQRNQIYQLRLGSLKVRVLKVTNQTVYYEKIYQDSDNVSLLSQCELEKFIQIYEQVKVFAGEKWMVDGVVQGNIVLINTNADHVTNVVVKQNSASSTIRILLSSFVNYQPTEEN
jgi:hypothetical protein